MDRMQFEQVEVAWVANEEPHSLLKAWERHSLHRTMDPFAAAAAEEPVVVVVEVVHRMDPFEFAEEEAAAADKDSSAEL